MIMSEERFKEGTSYKMSYEEYKTCYCPDCERKKLYSQRSISKNADN